MDRMIVVVYRPNPGSDVRAGVIVDCAGDPFSAPDLMRVRAYPCAIRYEVTTLGHSLDEHPVSLPGAEVEGNDVGVFVWEGKIEYDIDEDGDTLPVWQGKWRRATMNEVFRACAGMPAFGDAAPQ